MMYVVYGIDNYVTQGVISRCSVIDIEDGGDKWYRKNAYSDILNRVPSF